MITDLIAIAGVVAVLVGIWMLSHAAALIVGGMIVYRLAVQLERNKGKVG